MLQVELGNMAASGVLRFRDAHVDDDLMSSDSDTTHNANNSGNKYTKLPNQGIRVSGLESLILVAHNFTFDICWMLQFLKLKNVREVKSFLL